MARTPSSTGSDTLFPYTTLLRSRATGHRTLHIATHKLVKNDLVLLTQRVAFEAGIDLFPSRWHSAAESARRDFWVIGVQFAESLIAQDMAGFKIGRAHV